MKKIFGGMKYEKYYKEMLPYIKKEKNQQYFKVILTLGAAIFFILFAINPAVSTIVKLRREINDSSFVEKRLSEKISNLSNLSTQYQSIQEDLPYILDAIPKDPEVPTLVAQVQSIANESSVGITKLDVASVNLIGSAASISSSFVFEINGQGDYENLRKFISDLINMQRIVSVSSISISKDTGIDSNLGIKIRGFAYFKK